MPTTDSNQRKTVAVIEIRNEIPEIFFQDFQLIQKGQ